MEVTIKEIEVSRLNLKPGETLLVKITDDYITESAVSSLREHMEHLFPNNKVLVFSMPSGSSVDFEIIKQGDKDVES